MSYMRGAVYIWADDTRVHFWAADGEDYWQESGWGLHAQESARSAEDSDAQPSGVSLQQDVADAYVMMRLSELIEENGVDAALDRALQEQGNFGCRALHERSEAIRAALHALTSA